MRDNPSVLADVCEAVIAALYLDGGLERRARFVERWWEPRLAALGAPPRDPKTALQEWAQARGLPLPAYQHGAERGAGASPRFTVTVRVEGLPPATATGSSKRAAETAAAAAALAALDGRRMSERRADAAARSRSSARPTPASRRCSTALVGAKVSIVSPKVQTTRARVLGIAMRGDGAAHLHRHARHLRAEAPARARHGRRPPGPAPQDADLRRRCWSTPRAASTTTRARILDGLAKARAARRSLALNKIDRVDAREAAAARRRSCRRGRHLRRASS